MSLQPTTLLTPLLALLSLYAAQISYIAITNLLKYEERSEKAAKLFDKAADDLYKTRVTQASGAAAVCIHYSLYGPEWFYDPGVCVSRDGHLTVIPEDRAKKDLYSTSCSR